MIGFILSLIIIVAGISVGIWWYNIGLPNYLREVYEWSDAEAQHPDYEKAKKYLTDKGELPEKQYEY